MAYVLIISVAVEKIVIIIQEIMSAAKKYVVTEVVTIIGSVIVTEMIAEMTIADEIPIPVTIMEGTEEITHGRTIRISDVARTMVVAILIIVMIPAIANNMYNMKWHGSLMNHATFIMC